MTTPQASVYLTVLATLLALALLFFLLLYSYYLCVVKPVEDEQKQAQTLREQKETISDLLYSIFNETIPIEGEPIPETFDFSKLRLSKYIGESKN